LAVGYLGFDVAVNTNGDIGYPIPTFKHLTGKIPNPPLLSNFGADTNTDRIRAWLKASPASHQTQLEGWLGRPFLDNFGLTSVLDTAQFSGIRSNIVAHFQINP